jgi:hypothetical protein
LADEESQYFVVAFAELANLIWVGGQDLGHERVDRACIGDLLETAFVDDLGNAALAAANRVEDLIRELAG